jgi:hypothetical protein
LTTGEPVLFSNAGNAILLFETVSSCSNQRTMKNEILQAFVTRAALASVQELVGIE